MLYNLNSKAIAEKYWLIEFEVISSTNNVAFDVAEKIATNNISQNNLADLSDLLNEKAKISVPCLENNISLSNTSSLADKFWVVAKQQTAGRGRLGRSWVSPLGNLYSTLLLKNYTKNINYGFLSCIAGLSVMETALYFSKQYNVKNDNITLKWPNDVYIGDKKLSGILIEVKKNLNVDLVAIGIGVNIVKAPDIINYPTISLNDFGICCTASEFFNKLSYYWVENYNLFKQNGNQHIIAKWLSYCHFVGKNVIIKNNDTVITGIFKTIDEDFNCIIKSSTGKIEQVNSGDMLFGS